MNCQIAGLRSPGWKASLLQATVAGALLLCGFQPLPARAQAQLRDRIAQAVQSNSMQLIHGTINPMVARAQDAGALPTSTRIEGMSLNFRRSKSQQADLIQLLQAQQTKGSPLYHQWLQPAQFAARFGVSQPDLAKAAAWLQSQGFRIDAIPPSADRIDFSGTAAQVNAAFRTSLHQYSLNGQMHWANSTDLSLPQALAGVALGVGHLNTFRPVPQFMKKPLRETRDGAGAALSPHYTVQNGGEVNLLAPADIATIYDVQGLYQNGVTGNGQTIGVAGQTDITQSNNQSDISNFRSLSGLNAANMPSQVLVPNSGTAQVYAGDLEEADIDVEWSGAVAKDAGILYVTVGNNTNKTVFDALTYAVQTPLIHNGAAVVPVISVSYGACEPGFAGSTEVNTLEQVFQQANAQGQTIVASSGDSGSADCDSGTNSSGQVVAASQGLAVDYPASSQYVTGAGGTSFNGDLANQAKYWSQSNSSANGSALAYIPETTWNDTATMSQLTTQGSLAATGGGASTLFSKPSWQTGSGVPADSHRDVPDVSLAADPQHDGYVLCTEETNAAGTSFTGTSSCVYPVGANQVPYFDASGNGYLYGGTSIAAPQLAAMITLWNQAAGNTQGLGNANPVFYAFAQNTPGVFHNITTGSNAVVCQSGTPNCVPDGSGGYVMSCCNASSGYNQTTGLGSVDVAAMAAVWPAVGASNPNFSLFSSPGVVSVSPGSTASTTLVLTSTGGFSGAVTLACSNLPANTSCSFSPGASANLAAGGTQSVTFTLSATSAAHLERQPHPFGDRGWPLQAVFAGVFGLSLVGLGRKRRHFPRAWMTVLLLAAGLMAATALTACGSGTSPSGGGTGGAPPPAGKTSLVTVTGTSGSTTATAQIQVTIT